MRSIGADDACMEKTRLTTFFNEYNREFFQYDENLNRTGSFINILISFEGLIDEINDKVESSS
jgi:hypothetical protein